MREENVKIVKIQKSSKAALTITTIVKIFAIAMAVVACLCGFLIIGLRETVNKEFTERLTSGQIQSEGIIIMMLDGEIRQEIIQEDDMAKAIGVHVITVGVMMICLAVVMHFISKVFKEMKESYSPFKPEIIKSLKISFILITILSLSSSLLIGAVIGFSLWCVLHVFEYGCELQRQSDETL